MMVSTQQHEVVQAGRTAVQPGRDVVRVAVGRGSGAPGVHAAPVAHPQRLDLSGGGQPLASADVER